MKISKKINKKNMYTYHIKEMLFVKTFKTNLVKVFLCIALFLFAILLTILPYIISQRNRPIHRQMRYPTDLKYILFWKPPHRNPFKRSYFNEFENGQRGFIDQKCDYINCFISYNKSFLNNDENNFDAIVFDVHDVSKLKNIDFNGTRSPNQRYIFRSHESAEKHPVCNPLLEDFFSWTWTYRLDSEIPHPFVNIYDIKNKLVGPSKGIKWVKTMNHSDSTSSKTQFKKKSIAWVVTRCRLKNKHQDLVQELRNELKGYNYSVDVYGPCGDKKCPNGSLAGCFKMIERDYYFQMALEDSIAEDYVGEHIVKLLSYFTVPIVYGGADYTKFLPPGTYINAKAFDVKKLGALIDYLIKNPHMYEYFFDWKNHYFYTVKHRSQVCDLCAKLNTMDMKDQKPKKEFRKWWNPDYEDVCQRMHLRHLFQS